MNNAKEQGVSEKLTGRMDDRPKLAGRMIDRPKLFHTFADGILRERRAPLAGKAFI